MVARPGNPMSTPDGPQWPCQHIVFFPFPLKGFYFQAWYAGSRGDTRAVRLPVNLGSEPCTPLLPGSGAGIGRIAAGRILGLVLAKPPSAPERSCLLRRTNRGPPWQSLLEGRGTGGCQSSGEPLAGFPPTESLEGMEVGAQPAPGTFRCENSAVTVGKFIRLSVPQFPSPVK